ncbi:MAG TPA: sulfur transferase domain-containing protein [Rudaea sp.]|nr:sulfur transferase domain-containing protein [Rudaea sp.]
MIRIALFLMAICTLASASAATPTQTALANLSNVSFPAPHRVASGAVHADDVAELKKAGVQEVIDLRADEETPHFDEAQAMRNAGIGFHQLPIRGMHDMSRDNVIKFDQLLADAGDKLTLVHCASSNRVGAMIALRAAIIQGKPVDDALAEGRHWGLRSLQPAVVQRINALKQEHPIRSDTQTRPSP